MSITFEWFYFKRPCVSWHVSLSFAYSFWMKFIWEVFNTYINIFGKKRPSESTKGPSKGLSGMIIQEPLRKDPFLKVRTAQTTPNDGGSRRLMVQSTPLNGCCRLVLGNERIPSQGPASVQNYRPTERSVYWETLCWLPCFDGVVNLRIYCEVQGFNW